MPECLPDLPRYIRRLPDGSWLGAPGKHGPWRSIPAPQSGLPWTTDGPAVPESREPASVTPEATGQPRQLSPAAQAVDRAIADRIQLLGEIATSKQIAAAALRALADQDETLFDGDEELMPAVRAVRTDRILAIAAELEVSHD